MKYNERVGEAFSVSKDGVLNVDLHNKAFKDKFKHELRKIKDKMKLKLEEYKDHEKLD